VSRTQEITFGFTLTGFWQRNSLPPRSPRNLFLSSQRKHLKPSTGQMSTMCCITSLVSFSLLLVMPWFIGTMQVGIICVHRVIPAARRLRISFSAMNVIDRICSAALPTTSLYGWRSHRRRHICVIASWSMSGVKVTCLFIWMTEGDIKSIAKFWHT